MNLIITASPDKDGITASVAKNFYENLHGDNVVVCLNDENLNKCTACGKRGWGDCLHSGECASDESFNKIMHILESAELAIFVTPVYFYEMSESCKNFFDKLKRCQFSEKFNKLKNKKSVFVACAGGSGNGTTSTVEMFTRANFWLKTDNVSNFEVTRANYDEMQEVIKKFCKAFNIE